VKLNERYLLGPQIGEGGFGKTYRGTDEQSGDEVVIKELTLRGLPDWKPVEHFEREAKVLASLSHPGVPAFVDAFRLEGEGGDLRYFIVSERIAGETLKAKIDAGYRWSEPDALALTRGLLDILSYLHSIVPPVIHRDIKPANIVLRPDGTPVLVDFGAVRDLGVSGNTTATVLGTPGYMAPEQALGRSDPRSDLYGLGATLAHVFTHRHPQDLLDTSMRLDARALNALPESVRSFIAAMTEPDPAARPATALACLEVSNRSDDEAPPTPSTALATMPERVEHLPAPTGGRELPPKVKEYALLAGMRPEKIKRRLLPFMGLTFAGAFGLALVPKSVAVFFPFLVLGGFGWMLGGALLDARRARRAAKHGIKTIGSITAANAAQQGTFLEFTYQANGQTYEGHGYTRDALAIAKLEKGSPITVYYDPEKPEHSLGTLLEF
jgi:hypothetical protein